MSGDGYTLGTCRYCGQVVSLERERPTQEAADIAASEECSCYDAREERAICRKIENAQDRIQKVFGSEAEELGFRPINAPEPIQLMNDIAVLIARGYIPTPGKPIRYPARPPETSPDWTGTATSPTAGKSRGTLPPRRTRTRVTRRSRFLRTCPSPPPRGGTTPPTGRIRSRRPSRRRA